MYVELTPDQRAFVWKAIETGRFNREEEAVAEALALWEERERRRLEILAMLDEADACFARDESCDFGVVRALRAVGHSVVSTVQVDVLEHAMAYRYRESRVRLPLIAMALLLLLASVSTQAPTSPALPDCNASGPVRYICGLNGPEDLAAVPKTNWVIASAMSGEGGLYLIDTKTAAVSRIFPGAGAVDRFDRKEYGGCPGPLNPKQAVTHGLNLKPGKGSVHTLFAVHHGDRESIEVFEINAKSTPPSVAWIGCAVVPDPVGINSVAALPDDGFVLTNFDPRQPPPPGGRGGGPSSKLMSGEQNGELWEWHAKSGWAKVPGSEAAGANGIEVSRDGKTPVERQEIPLGFRTDNIRWAPDGKTLIVAGQGTVATQPGAQRGGPAPATVVVRVNPQTMAHEELLNQASPPGLSAASVALPVGDELWVGSFRGDRLVRYPAPARK